MQVNTPGHHINQFYVPGEDGTESEHVQGLMEIDESNFGEPLVLGLTEGEYCDLCVEERLSALFLISVCALFLISVVNEGNFVRTVFEKMGSSKAVGREL